MRPPFGGVLPGGAMGGVRPPPSSGGYSTGYAHPSIPLAMSSPLAPLAPSPPLASSTSSMAMDTVGKAGFLLHVDDRHTFEGFAYSSQWLLFPFVEIAHETDLTPIFRNANVLENRSSDLDIGSFLGFSARYTLEELQENTKLITLDMWELDRPRQDVLVPMVKQAVESNQDPNDPRPLTIFINGPLQQVPHASDSVVQWLKRRAALWVDRRQLKVAMHILADAATPSLFDEMIDTVQASAPQVLSGQVDLFLDADVSEEGEQWISSRCPGARCHRLTASTLLQDLQVIGAADVFMGAPSYFSTFAGYFFQFDGVIIVGSQPGQKGYFNHHFQYMNNIYGIEDPNLQAALHQLVAGKFGGGY